MITMTKYPSKEFARNMITDAEMATRVEDLAEYRRTAGLAEYSGEFDPNTVRAFLNFYDELRKQYPEATIDRDLKIKRLLTQDELEDLVLSDLRQHMYYNPDEYPGAE